MTHTVDEKTLLEKAHALAGMTFHTLAQTINQTLPTCTSTGKGWIGQMLEKILGADAGNRPAPDFQQLGIELKTIPLNQHGKPRESTFVCHLSLLKVPQMTWETSLVKQKLSKVLWIPIEGDPSVPFTQRRIGSPILWQPNAEQIALLKTDWQEFIDRIALGELDQITAHQGRCLQIRPKAANNKALCDGFNERGEKIRTLPRGFYLRARFTQTLLPAFK